MRKILHTNSPWQYWPNKNKRFCKFIKNRKLGNQCSEINLEKHGVLWILSGCTEHKQELQDIIKSHNNILFTHVFFPISDSYMTFNIFGKVICVQCELLLPWDSALLAKCHIIMKNTTSKFPKYVNQNLLLPKQPLAIWICCDWYYKDDIFCSPTGTSCKVHFGKIKTCFHLSDV